MAASTKQIKEEDSSTYNPVPADDCRQADDAAVERMMSATTPTTLSASSSTTNNDEEASGSATSQQQQKEQRQRDSYQATGTTAKFHRRRQQSAVGLRHALHNINGIGNKLNGEDDDDRRSTSNSQYQPSMQRRFSVSMCLTNAQSLHRLQQQKSKESSVEVQEAQARQIACQRPSWHRTLLNLLAAIKVFLCYLITVESLLTCLLSVGLTYFWYDKLEDDRDQTKDGSIDRVLLTFGKF